MTPSRPYLRYLRIAFSVTCGIACVLLVVLWVRSYWYLDQFIRGVTTTDYVAYTSVQGQFVIGIANDFYLEGVYKQGWTKLGFRIDDWYVRGPDLIPYFPVTAPGPLDEGIMRLPRYSRSPFGVVKPQTKYSELILPYWLLFFSMTAFAALPWIRWRFSLRTLLFATTLVAVVLGAIIYAAR